MTGPGGSRAPSRAASRAARRPRGPWVVAAVVLSAGISGVAGPAAPADAAAQVPPDSAAPERRAAAPNTGGWAGWAALPHPWSTVVALTVVIPGGSALDPEGVGGTAWLLGRTAAAAIRGRLGGAGVRVEADVQRTRTVYRVLAVPAAWGRAYRAVEEFLFDEPDAPPGLDEARTSLLSVHAFEAGAPVREFEREVYRMLDGAGDPWTRDPRGVPETLEAVTAEDLAAYRRRHYDRSASVLTVTGAADPAEVARRVTGDADAGAAPGAALLRDTAAADTTAADTAGARRSAAPSAPPRPGEARVAVGPPPARPPRPAWSRGDRIHLVRDVTSGWIAAAWPVDPATPRTLAEMVVHQVRSQLITDPPPPGLFSSEVTLENLPAGVPALVVRVAVLPESVEAWETRIMDTVERMSAERLEPGFFRFHRRRFRNLRLVEDAQPEAEGLRSALDLRRTGRPRDLSAEIWEADADALHRAVASLGPPRILVFGPDLGSGGTVPGEP